MLGPFCKEYERAYCVIMLGPFCRAHNVFVFMQIAFVHEYYEEEKMQKSCFYIPGS